MRSPNELAKAVTMFTSDAMKVAGRVMDAYGEIAILKARIRAETDTAVKEQLQQQLKKAKKKAFKASSSLMLSATFMAVVTQAFKHLYGKHEEDEELAENMKVDIIGNLLGGLPLFKDLYAKVAEGYDFEGMVFSSINDLFTAFGEVLDFAGEVKGGTADSRDWLSTLKKLAYSIGQITGIPIRNVYNVVFGLIKRVSPETAYKIDDAFYKQSYSADLKKAIENNDDEMIETIAGLLMDENIGSFKNSTTRKEINRLVALDLNVLPTSIGKSMTINDVEYKLSEKDQMAFKKVYSGAIDAVDKLVASKGYQISSDEAKAKAINYVYRYYYYEAQSKTLDIELDTKLYLFGQLIPIETMALALAEVSSLPAGTKNKKATVQRYIQSLKLKAEQKYMLMGYFGYKNTKGESAVMSAISKSSLTEAQKTLLFSKSFI